MCCADNHNFFDNVQLPTKNNLFVSKILIVETTKPVALIENKYNQRKKQKAHLIARSTSGSLINPRNYTLLNSQMSLLPANYIQLEATCYSNSLHFWRVPASSAEIQPRSMKNNRFERKRGERKEER